MDIFSNIAAGFGVALAPANLLACLAGCVLGTLTAVLPGVGPVAMIALLLPAAYELSPVPALIMLAGVYYGAQYGGSTTAILANVPGVSSSAVTCIDGHQMARQGRAGPALAAAGLASLFGGFVGTAVLAAVAPPLTELAFNFGPAEYFSLMVAGLVGAVVLASGSLVKAIAMIVLGMLLATVGTDAHSGIARFAFDMPALSHGIGFVAVAIGVFGYGQVIGKLALPEDSREVLAPKSGPRWPAPEDFRAIAPAVLRGTTLGAVLGVLPGGGALLSSFVSYAFERSLGPAPGEVEFGKGNIRGVAAPESANNAGAQTSFLPLLTLGIPPNAVMALLIGTMTLHGIQPGPQVMTGHPLLFWGLVASMWIGNLMLVLLNVPFVRVWARVAAVPYRWVFPALVLAYAAGSYAIRRDPFDVWLAGAFGAAGYAFSKLGCESAPLLLGFILGPMVEDNLRRALELSHGDWGVFITRPVSAGLLAGAVALLLVVALPTIKARRREAFVED
jgi:TctA family transporter